MSAATDILAELSTRGVAVRVEGETLKLRPRVALDDELLARIKEHKPEIIRTLQDAIQGLNHIWARIRGVNQTFEIRATLTEACWHCHGQKACDCSCCQRGLGNKLEPGPCRACAGTGRLSWSAKVQ